MRARRTKEADTREEGGREREGRWREVGEAQTAGAASRKGKREASKQDD